MKPEHEALWFAVRARDGGLCVQCDEEGRKTLAECVHHIVHRSLYAEERIWRPENLISLCSQCHRGADAKAMRSKHLGWLAKRYGYCYDGERPWSGYL